MATVVGGRAKVGTIVIPAPLVAIIPVRESVLEAFDTLIEESFDLMVSGFDE
jgi:hypothetical protein